MTRLRPLPAVLALVLLVQFVCTAGDVRADDLAGKKVVSIFLKDDHGAPWPNPGDLLPLLEVKPGDTFSREAVRKGLEYLYLKGLFRDVRVDAFPEGEGLRLDYTFLPLILVDKVVLRGNHSVANRDVLGAIGNLEGKELREKSFPDIRAAIQAIYQSQGYYGTKVNFREEPSKRPNRVVLYVYITEPKQTVIASVKFTGNTVFRARDLLSVMRNRPGKPLLTDVLFDRDLEAIRKKYASAGYPAAKPGPVSMSFQGNRAYLEIAGEEGPRVTTTFTGTTKFCREEFPILLPAGTVDPETVAYQAKTCADFFRGLLLIWSEGDVSDPAIDSSVQNIRTAYRDRGYADATVDVRKTAGPGTLNLVFSVHEGPRVAVRSVRIEGNSAFTAKEIRGLMETRPSGWLKTRFFRQDVLDSDADALRDLYAASGYLSAAVHTSVTRSPDGTKADVLVGIEEGRRTVTGTVSFAGNAALSDAELEKALVMRQGDPFSETVLEEDRYRILMRYAAKGYLYARVEAEKQPAAGTRGEEVMNIRYSITEDRPVIIGKIILRGNAYTEDKVITRELEPKTGEPYNYESILKSQQRIYRYGYFSVARFEPVHPYEKEYVKDMLFTVEERDAGAVEFGVGYGDLDRLRGFVEVSHRNLWGTARFASLRIEGSDILKRAALTYQEPWFLGRRSLSDKLLLIWSDAKRINQDTREVYYQTRQQSISFGPEWTHDGLKGSLTYQFQNVDNYNVEPAATLSPDDSGWVRVSSLNPSLLYDRRDDFFNPTRGSVHGINVKEALPALRSKADFTKATAQTTWFFPAAEHTVVALSARAGMGWPHGDTQELPIHERFYLGGGTTVRGYTQDSIGPFKVDASGTRVPTGGSSMVQLNAELRLSSAGGGGVVFFTDAGNVWAGQQIRLNDLRASYGIGLRYHTPVGPLRIDYGQKIHRRPGESPGELHFNIGQAF